MKTLKLMNLFLLFPIVILTIGCVRGVKDQPIPLSSLSEKYKSNFLNQEKVKSVIADGTKYSRYSNSIPQVRDSLENMKLVVKIYYGNINSDITIPGFGGIKLGKEESNLNVYYLETKIVVVNGDTSVYGCGYSLHYLFKKVEKGITLDNIPSVAASAQLNSKKTQVFYSIQSYGMTGSALVPFFKPVVNKNFNVEGFGVLQSSLDGIHNVMSSDVLSNSVKYTPVLLKFIKPYDLEQE